jgi:hypothetical protein
VAVRTGDQVPVIAAAHPSIVQLIRHNFMDFEKVPTPAGGVEQQPDEIQPLMAEHSRRG